MDHKMMDQTKNSMGTDKQAVLKDVLGPKESAWEGVCLPRWCLGKERSPRSLQRAQHKSWGLQDKVAFSE